jgi:hypothetical protein
MNMLMLWWGVIGWFIAVLFVAIYVDRRLKFKELTPSASHNKPHEEAAVGKAFMSSREKWNDYDVCCYAVGEIPELPAEDIDVSLCPVSGHQDAEWREIEGDETASMVAFLEYWNRTHKIYGVPRDFSGQERIHQKAGFIAGWTARKKKRENVK